MDGLPGSAWCDEPVEHPTYLREIPFHWVCLKKRMAALPLITDETRQRGRAARAKGDAALRLVE